MQNPTDVLHQDYEMLLESQFWPRAKMVALQRQRIEPLVRHARTTTSFYCCRLDPLFRADGSIDWEQWLHVPIVKRADILAAPEALIATSLPEGHGPVGQTTTSGTTGHRLTVLNTHRAMIASRLTRWRADAWYALDWSKIQFVRNGEDERANWPAGAALGPWGPPWDEGARAGNSFLLNRLALPPQQLEFMKRVGATYAATGPGKLAYMLAMEAERRGLALDLDAVFVHGEAADELDRDACKRVFGARVIDLYSSKEGNHMAYRCPSHGVWHVNEENLLLEIVDDYGRPSAPGQTGRVIITPFLSYPQPLIRYDPGDVAVAGAVCGCGRTLLTIQEISGRVRHLFRHPDGRVVTHNFPDLYRKALQAGPWQFAQVGPVEFEIRYVPLDWGIIGAEDAVAEAFREWFFADAKVGFRRLKEIPLTASGKYIEYISEIVN